MTLDQIKTEAKEQLFTVLDKNPGTAEVFLDALNNGRVDGGCYYGECSCLLGTIGQYKDGRIWRPQNPFVYWNPGDHHRADKGWWWYDGRPDGDHGPFLTEEQARSDMDSPDETHGLGPMYLDVPGN